MHVLLVLKSNNFPSPPSCDPQCLHLSDVLLHVGSRRRTSQQYTAGGCLRTLHSASLQSIVPSLRPAGVHLQRLFNVDRVQVEEHQGTHIPGGQSRPGGKPRVKVRNVKIVHIVTLKLHYDVIFVY